MTASPPNRLIILTHEFAPFRGGAAIYAEELGVALHQKGLAVEIWAPDYGRSDLVETTPVSVLRLSAGGSLRLGHQVQFVRALSAQKTELEAGPILLASLGAHLAWFWLMARGKVPSQQVISLLHGSEVLRFEKNPFWRMLAKRFFQRARAVVTVSEFSKELIRKSFLGELVKEIVVAPGAASTAASRAVIPTERDEKIRVLTLARLHPRKGQLDTARALGQLPVDVRGRVIYQVGGVGDEKYLSEVEGVCRSSGVEFEYLGEVGTDELAGVYERCDIYAMTSRTLPRSVEGLGISYLEAGFHGKPVVAYRTGGVAEAVMDGETGLLVEEGHTGALAKAFSKLIGAENLRARLGANGKKHAARFDWKKTAEIISRAVLLQLP